MFRLLTVRGKDVLPLVWLVPTFLSACTGSIAPAGTTTDSAPDETQVGNKPGTKPVEEVGGTVDADGVRCSSKPKFVTAATSELARLTSHQYSRSIEGLLGTQTTEGLAIDFGGASARVHGFENFEAQGVSETTLSALDQTAVQLGKSVRSRALQLAPCSGSTDAEKRSCGKTFIAKFGKSAFRRPLTPEETSRWQALFDSQLAAGGYELAVGALTEAFLMAPQFLYRIEKGTVIDGAESLPVRKLTDHELATRLSYFLTDGPPDTALLAMADEGKLHKESVLREQALRLLDSPFAKEVTAQFHRQWLNLDELSDLTRTHPKIELDDEKETALREGTERFVASVFWDDAGSVKDLFTAPYTFVNKTLSPFYDANVSGDGFERVTFDPQRRAGLLTQAGWLAQHSHRDTDSPIFRGHFVAERVLCDPPSPVPDGLVVQFPDEDLQAPPMTTRERTEGIHESVAVCGACHVHFDLYGYAFGHYDNVGRWRDQETVRGASLPINATANITETRDLNGPIDGAYELGRKLGDSKQVAECLAIQWFRFAFGRTETNNDACALVPIVEAATAQTGAMKDIALAIVLGEAFRFIPVRD